MWSIPLIYTLPLSDSLAPGAQSTIQCRPRLHSFCAIVGTCNGAPAAHYPRARAPNVDIPAIPRSSLHSLVGEFVSVSPFQPIHMAPSRSHVTDHQLYKCSAGQARLFANRIVRVRALALLHLCAGPAVHSPSSGPVRIGPGAEGVAPLVLTVVASPLDLAIAFAPALRLGEQARRLVGSMGSRRPPQLG